jgi:hypothetical protein
VNGKLVKQIGFDKQNTTFQEMTSLKMLDKGMYIMTIIIDGAIENRKIMRY